jgi:hypothetical protein
MHQPRHSQPSTSAAGRLAQTRSAGQPRSIASAVSTYPTHPSRLICRGVAALTLGPATLGCEQAMS